MTACCSSPLSKVPRLRVQFQLQACEKVASDFSFVDGYSPVLWYSPPIIIGYYYKKGDTL